MSSRDVTESPLAKLGKRVAKWRSRREALSLPSGQATNTPVHKRTVSLPMLDDFNGGGGDPMMPDSSLISRRAFELTETLSPFEDQQSANQSPQPERLVIPRVIARQAGPVYLPQQGFYRGAKDHRHGMALTPTSSRLQHPPSLQNLLPRTRQDQYSAAEAQRQRLQVYRIPSTAIIAPRKVYEQRRHASETLSVGVDHTPSLYSEIAGFPGSLDDDDDGHAFGFLAREATPPHTHSQVFSFGAASALEAFLASTASHASFDVGNGMTRTSSEAMPTAWQHFSADDDGEQEIRVAKEDHTNARETSGTRQPTTSASANGGVKITKTITTTSTRAPSLRKVPSTTSEQQHLRREDPFSLDESTMTFWLESERSLASIEAPAPTLASADPFDTSFQSTNRSRQLQGRPLSPVHSQYSWAAVYTSGSDEGCASRSDLSASLPHLDGHEREREDEGEESRLARHILCHWSPTQDHSVSTFASNTGRSSVSANSPRIPDRRSSICTAPAPTPVGSFNDPRGSVSGEPDESFAAGDRRVSYWCPTQDVLEDYLNESQRAILIDR